MARARLISFFGLALFLALAQANLSHALEVPPLKGRVNDLAGLISRERERALEERLARFEQESGHQIALLTIPSLEGEDIEGFGIRVAESWKIGKKGFDNGVILLIAKDDRKLRIEVGYGLEGVLPDARASRIIREIIVPRFRQNDFAGGIEAGIEAIIKATRGEQISEKGYNLAPEEEFVGSWWLVLIPFSLLLIFFYFLMRASFDHRFRSAWAPMGEREPALWTVLDEGLGPGESFSRGLLRTLLRNLFAPGYKRRGGDWGGSGGGWSSGGGGYFGGFGGGSGGGGFSGGGGGFGGGGASGSW